MASIAFQMIEMLQRAYPLTACQTDCGRVRDHNEDAVFASAEAGLAVLADGMGGYNAGEVAARMAVDVVAQGILALINKSPDMESVDSACGLMNGTQWLRDQVLLANEAIFESAINDPECEGMGTTVVCALLGSRRLAIAHVGDSRCYQLRNGVLTQLTRDHSLLQEQIDCGQWQAEHARDFPRKNLVTRALGAEHYVQVDIAEYAVQPGDIYLLCSDGLTDMLSTTQLTHLLCEGTTDLAQKVARLIQAANDEGGRDNISAVLMQVPGDIPVQKPSVIRKRKAA